MGVVPTCDAEVLQGRDCRNLLEDVQTDLVLAPLEKQAKELLDVLAGALLTCTALG